MNASSNCLRRFYNFCRCAKNNETITWKQTVPWKPPITGGVVIKVYDGDTITIAEKLPYADSPLYRWSVRLSGIDAPELKSKSFALKAVAEEGRDALWSKIFGKRVELKDVGTEKYGRVLATVLYDGENMNTWMLKKKYAYVYQGQKKLTEQEQIDLLIHP